MEAANVLTMRTRLLMTAVMAVVGCSGQVGTVEADGPVRYALEQAAEAHQVPVSVLAGVGFFGMQLSMPDSAMLFSSVNRISPLPPPNSTWNISRKYVLMRS